MPCFPMVTGWRTLAYVCRRIAGCADQRALEISLGEFAHYKVIARTARFSCWTATRKSCVPFVIRQHGRNSHRAPVARFVGDNNVLALGHAPSISRSASSQRAAGQPLSILRDGVSNAHVPRIVKRSVAPLPCWQSAKTYSQRTWTLPELLLGCSALRP